MIENNMIKNNSFSLERHIENIDILGYTILENIISKDVCKLISDKLDYLFNEEIKEYGKEKLKQLREWGMVRALLEKDDYFVNIVLNKSVFDVIGSILGESAILHLQNGVIIEPQVTHNQAKFHRDFEKNFQSDKPVSLNAFWAIDDFNEQTGGTWLVPYTHKLDKWPSTQFLEDNAIQVKLNSGGVIIFDSRLIHRGGNNYSEKPRRGINNQYTKPFIKQQIDLPALLANKYDLESKISQVLGFWSIPPKSISQFRCDPDKRTYRSGQG